MYTCSLVARTFPSAILCISEGSTLTEIKKRKKQKQDRYNLGKNYFLKVVGTGGGETYLTQSREVRGRSDRMVAVRERTLF